MFSEEIKEHTNILSILNDFLENFIYSELSYNYHLHIHKQITLA